MNTMKWNKSKDKCTHMPNWSISWNGKNPLKWNSKETMMQLIFARNTILKWNTKETIIQLIFAMNTILKWNTKETMMQLIFATKTV